MKQVLNPYLPSREYVPDGEPHIFEGRLYVFGSHDRFGSPDFCVNDYVAWSAPLDDLTSWRYEGIIYRKTQDPKNPEGKSNMNAPDVCQGPDGRYYLYYQLHDKNMTSVAAADHPAGPYEFYGYVQHKDGRIYGSVPGDSFNFDPGMLTDDGRIFMYTGFSPNAAFRKAYQSILSYVGPFYKGGCCVELLPDMITLKDGITHVLIPGEQEAVGTPYEGHGFYEASSPRKINGKYYLVYSSALSHELCYAVSHSPTGGFTFGGTIISIGDVGLPGIPDKASARNYTGNTHGGLTEIGGQWYIFYHRQTNKLKCNRQGCAERITILPDGSIPQAEVTSCGLNNGPLRGVGTYGAYIACNLWCREPSFSYDAHTKGDFSGHPCLTQSGEDTDFGECRDPGEDQYIANMRDGAVAGFKYFDFASDRPAAIRLRIRGKAKGSVRVLDDPKSLQPLAELPVDIDETADWQEFTVPFTAPTGVRPLYFTFGGSGYIDFMSFTLE